MKKSLKKLINSIYSAQMIQKLIAIVCAIATTLCMLTGNGMIVHADTDFTVVTDVYVPIENVGSGKFANIYGNKDANNTNFDVYTRDYTNGQNFKFVSTKQGYVIVPECSKSRAVNIYTSKNAKDGDNVCTWKQTGHSTQAWIPEYVEEYDAFIIRSANNPKLVLTATGSKNSSSIKVKNYKKGDKYQLFKSDALVVTGRSSNNSDATKMIDKVCEQYGIKAGRYWTYKGNNSTSYTASDYPVGKNGYKGYSYGGGIQCWAFARFLMSEVTGVKVGKGNWKKIDAKNVKELKVGDIVCTGDSTHTAVVYKDLGNGEFQFIEVWGSVKNKIAIGKYNDKQASTLSQLKNKGLVYVYRYNDGKLK